MDTVNLVLSTILVLALTTILACAWALRERFGKLAAQRDLTRLVAQSRPRSPQKPAAGYDTGLVEVVKVLDQA